MLRAWAAAGILAAFLFAAGAARGERLPLGIADGGSGVNVHFLGGHAADLARIRALGFSLIRTDLRWSAVETRRGQYDWTEPDRFMADLRGAGLRALLILDSSNALYEEKLTQPIPGIRSPSHAASIAAFAAFAAAAAQRYRADKPIFELWNEPDWRVFWHPAPDPDAYANLANATCHALRRANPESTIIGPALAHLPVLMPESTGFLTTMLDRLDLGCLDGFSVHPYRRTDPATIGTEIADIDRRLAAKGAALPVLFGEWGYASHDTGVSPRVQADRFTAIALTALRYGVKVMIWYDYQNDGGDPHDPEQNFGLIDQTGQEKPAAAAARILFATLRDHPYRGFIAGLPPGDTVLIFAGSTTSNRLLAGWTSGAAHPVTVALPGFVPKKAEISRDVLGTPRANPVHIGGGGVTLMLSPAPAWISLDGP